MKSAWTSALIFPKGALSLARNVGKHDVSVLEFDSELGLRQRLNDDAFHLNGFFFGQGLLYSDS